jgi:hypothetical protein
MILRVDSKNRLFLSFAQSGDVFEIERREEDFFGLTRVKSRRPAKKALLKTATANN